jgi:predicted RND superfamily exporter protein
MNTKATRNSIALIVLAFIVAIVFGILSKQSVDTQEIKYYLENTASVAQAHNKWLKEYGALTELYIVLDQNKKIEDLNKLLDQMEEIKNDVDESTPPNKLESLRIKWSDECHLILQAIFLLIEGIERNNIEWISEAYDLLIEAENTRRQWKEYLSNLLINNDIEISDNAYSIYFN